jgi:hypothetical protein
VATHSRTDVPEQTHDAMRAAALRPMSGSGAAQTLAAGGGLEVPGGEARGIEGSIIGMGDTGPHEPIPGERDGDTLTHREPGAIGGAFNGQDNLPAPVDGLMDQQTVRDRVLEGGGADAARRFDKRGGQ